MVRGTLGLVPVCGVPACGVAGLAAIGVTGSGTRVQVSPPHRKPSTQPSTFNWFGDDS